MMMREIASLGYPLSRACPALMSRPVRSSRQYMQGHAPLVLLIQPRSHVVCSHWQPGRAQCASYNEYVTVFVCCCSIVFPLVFVSAVSVSGGGPIPPPLVVWFSIILTLPVGVACRLVLPNTGAISSVIPVNWLPIGDPSA
jgi:hypothetical protein